MKAPCGVEMEIGQTWREVDPRFTRFVTILALDPTELHKDGGGVLIKAVGSMRKPAWASLHRFNGKRGGYEF